MLSRDLRSLAALVVDHTDPWTGAVTFPATFTSLLTGVLSDLIAQAEALEGREIPAEAGALPPGVIDLAARRASRRARRAVR